MVNLDKKHGDGFYDLLNTQIDQELPMHLEDRIMQKVEALPQANKSPFRLSALFIVGLLSSIYVCISILSAYYILYTPLFNDLKLTLGCVIILYTLYELNELFPILLQRLFRPRKHHTSI